VRSRFAAGGGREPTLDRLRRLHGDTIAIRNPEVYARQPFAPLYDLSHAAHRLGFVAKYDQRHLIGAASAN